MTKILHNLRFTAMMVKMMLKMKLMKQMVFRLNFFGVAFADGTLFIVQLLVFQAIYSQVESIGGWTRGQMLIFIGTFSIINGLSMMLVFFGVISIPGKIRDGSLDMYITKPGNALLRLVFESIDPGAILLPILSIGIVALGVSVSGIQMTAGIIVGYAVMVLLMTLLWCDTEIILRTLPFFFIGTDAVDQLEGSAVTLNFRIPGVLYTGVWKVLFYLILPYGIMASVPTQLLTRTLSTGGLIYALTVVAAFTWFMVWFWRFGLKHYKSASS